MKNQPDFSKIFNDYFGDKPKKVIYEVREEPNLIHDIVFLDSLVHDAEFRRKEIELNENMMIIPIKRNCPEISNYKVNSEIFYETNSILSISKVENVIWEFNNGIEFKEDKILYLHHLYLDFLSYKRLGSKINIILDDGFWKCKITVSSNKFKMVLKDLEIVANTKNRT